jgi:MFS transporter, DHA1 family, multidrug resistance protein
MSKNPQLPLILATAFLDILWLGIFIPVLPDIISRFGIAASWSGYTQGIYALGMFIGGLYFWRLSDIRGRKNILSITSILNLISYIIMLISIWSLPMKWSIPDSIWGGFTVFSSIFLISRFIGWLWWAGFGVVQAYISDISSQEERTKNMGLMGAMFGLGFLIWPALGAILFEYVGIHGTIIACVIAIAINILAVVFFLEEPKKHVEQEESDFFEKFSFSKYVIILFILTLGCSIAFASIQSMSPQYYKDVFWFTPREIGFTMSAVWLVLILYQGYFIKFVRKVFDEAQMIQAAFLVLIFAFIGFSLNTSPMWIYFWVAFFSLGMGSIQPSIGSLLSAKAGKEVGKVMWYNTSVASIGQIIWPILMGTLYTFSYTFPFLVSAGIFLSLLILVIVYFYEK